MQMRRYARAVLAGAGLAALGVAAPAAAAGSKEIEPLNQYVVTGKVIPRIWPARATTSPRPRSRASPAL